MAKSKPHIEYRFTVPFKGAVVMQTESIHSPSYPVGTTWDQVRKDWETPTWGPLQIIGLEWPAYAWPGGYPLYYVTKDGGCLSAEAANEHLELTLGDDPQWRIVAQEVNYECHDLVCDHTGKRIQAAFEWVACP